MINQWYPQKLADQKYYRFRMALIMIKVSLVREDLDSMKTLRMK